MKKVGINSCYRLDRNQINSEFSFPCPASYIHGRVSFGKSGIAVGLFYFIPICATGGGGNCTCSVNPKTWKCEDHPADFKAGMWKKKELFQDMKVLVIHPLTKPHQQAIVGLIYLFHQ